MYLLQVLPILAAGLVPLLVGSVWYHPRVFGALWMSLMHITPEMADRSARMRPWIAMLTIVFGVLCAAVLAFVIDARPPSSFVQVLLYGIATWAGIVVPSTIGRVWWDRVPLSLYLIETGQWLAALCVMTIILAW
jgi:Na+/melibiose symporter-like transporter